LEAVHHATVTLDDRLTESTRLGEAWWEEYFGEVVRNLSLVPSPDGKVVRRFCDALHQDHIRRNLWSHLAPQAFSVLDRLQEAGLVIGLISNSDGRVREQVEEQGMTPRFRFILDSFEEKCEKPDPEIFRRALKLGGIAAGETLYVGDFVNIDWKGATGAGLQAVIIDPTGKRRGRGIPTISRLADLPDFLGL
jgi:putative hydrolase of the HAD superfamily